MDSLMQMEKVMGFLTEIRLEIKTDSLMETQMHLLINLEILMVTRMHSVIEMAIRLHLVIG